MKTRAAVAWEVGKPLVIEEVDLEGPKEGRRRPSRYEERRTRPRCSRMGPSPKSRTPGAGNLKKNAPGVPPA